MVAKQEPWPLTKSMPITFTLAIIAQTVALVWYVSSLDNSIKNNSKDLLRQEARLNSLETVVHKQALTMARIDENIKSIRTAVEYLAKKDLAQNNYPDQ